MLVKRRLSMNRRDFIRSGGAATVMAMGGGACASISGGAGKLAILGGTPVMSEAERRADDGLFKWPIVNDAMRRANDKVLCDCNMSWINVSEEFEQRFAKWQGTKYASSAPNGTAALVAAFYAVGLGPGDELICPSITFWASCLGAIHLGATVVFCDVKADDLTMDPASFEAHITPRTKAVVPVHVYGQPCDMDAIMDIARKHGIKVVEDVSHAQGGFYKGRRLGTIGDCGAMSLMTNKSFAIGEGGMFVTDDRELYRRVVRWGQYERIGRCWSGAEIADTRALPVGGVKNRLNQCSAAIGIEQLKKYDSEIAEIDKAMKYFWKGIADVKGLGMIYPADEGSTKAGWYYSRVRYSPEAFEEVPSYLFAQACNAEMGGRGGFSAGCNFPLHLSSVFDDADIFGNGRPPARRNLPQGLSPKALTGRLPVAESIGVSGERIFGEPWFKHCDCARIDRYVEAVHKVAANAKALKAANVKSGPATPPGWS